MGSPSDQRKTERLPFFPPFVGISPICRKVANALYYNAALTLSILQKFGVVIDVFGLWLQMLQQVKKSGVPVNFKREHDKKVCCLGLTSLLSLPPGHLPAEFVGQVFRATLDLLVAYKDQIAASKEEDEGEGDEMEGFKTEEDDDESDGEMGDDLENGDDADSLRLQKLVSQAKGARSLDDNDDSDDSDDDFSEDEEFQTPIDDVGPFIFFADTIKGITAADPVGFQGLMQSLDFQYQARANGIAQHAEHRRVETEKERLEKATGSCCAYVTCICNGPWWLKLSETHQITHGFNLYMGV